MTPRAAGASDLFRFDQTASTGFRSGAYAGRWKTVSQERAAISCRILRLVWVGRGAVQQAGVTGLGEPFSAVRAVPAGQIFNCGGYELWCRVR